MALLVAGSLAVVVVAGLVVVQLVGDGEDVAGTFDDADPSEATIVAVPEGYVQAFARGLTLRLPSSWVWEPLDGDIEGIGSELAPDDPVMAEQLDARLQGIPRNALFIGFAEADLRPGAFNTNVIVMELPDALPDQPSTLRRAVEAEVDALADALVGVSYLETPEGPALRVHYTMSQQGIEAEALQYWFTTDEGPYTLSVTSDHLHEQYQETADAIAASFTLDD